MKYIITKSKFFFIDNFNFTIRLYYCEMYLISTKSVSQTLFSER